MIDETIPTWSARHYYDRLGTRHDWAERYEGRAKARALALLQVRPGLSVLNAGVGTGIDHRLIVRTVGAGGMAVGLDLSAAMLDLAHCRTGSPVVQADVRRLPFRPSNFDRLLSAYVLDLLPGSDLESVLSEFSRVLKPNGRMVLVSLTEGVSPASRALIATWKAAYRWRPLWLGGCRPLTLGDQLSGSDLYISHHETVVQLAVPSEIVVAVRSGTGERSDADSHDCL